jgi:hypothetical protein
VQAGQRPFPRLAAPQAGLTARSNSGTGLRLTSWRPSGLSINKPLACRGWVRITCHCCHSAVDRGYLPARQQAWPWRPVRPAVGRGGWPPDRGRYRLVRTARRPCGTARWPVVTGTRGFSRGNPPRRWLRVVTLAGRAHQPTESVLRPASGDRPSPIVGLPERGRIREGGPAPRHSAPGRRNPDLVANNTLPGDRDRMNQRIEPCCGPRGLLGVPGKGS